MPGAHTPLAALLAKRAGFSALYLSGAAVTATLALPDLGVLALDELTFFTRSICRAVDLPLVVDGDTGYGEALNVMRLIRELEDAGAAAVQLEDQILPKKCGHLSDKRLVSAEEMARKVAAAALAARCRGGDGGVLRRAGRDRHADGAARADAIAPGALRCHRLRRVRGARHHHREERRPGPRRAYPLMSLAAHETSSGSVKAVPD